MRSSTLISTCKDASGTVLAENDDGDGNRNSRIVFTATNTGTYYLDATCWTDGKQYFQGDYQLSVQKFVTPPVYSYDQIANQLTNGYWGGDWHHFDVTQGGTITVNITGLTAAGQTLARAALAEWTDVIGVNFKEVTGIGSDGQPNGQIVFDDSDAGAYTSSDWANHIITKSNVNISTDWIGDYGTATNSYSFQTYVHEIGHALGLGHAGNYNDTATYPDDALYSNDAWSTTVMSYFSQRDSSYFATQSFSYDFALTPMSADILAMQTLYGLSTTTRTGNTTYGYGSTAGNPVFDASVNPHSAYTIIDSGGTDTLNYSGSSANQLINLNPETFSNVAGDIGNMSIAVGTVIENATAGSGSDTIVGNSADNVLDGGTGDDTVSYEAASAGVTVDLSRSTAQNTVGAGTDTLKGFENLTGSGYADTLTAASTTASIHGGAGDDRINAANASANAHVYGDGGNDWFVPGSNYTWIDGGDGYDTVDFSGASAGIVQNSQSADTLTSIEQTIGSAFADNLAIANGDSGVVDKLIGGAGDDTLRAIEGAVQMEGGAGNDTYYVVGPSPYNPYSSVSLNGVAPKGATATIVEAAGQGTDLVQSEISFALPDNVENLQLVEGHESLDTNGTGNALANQITGDSGANTLSGLGGNDFLYGNAGSDTLDGGTGIDKMFGGTGDDTYMIRDATDYAYEYANEGTDLAMASVSYALRANIENLTLTGTANLAGKGNELDNVITGNDGANRLSGMAGDDTLVGGGGRDILDGGTGNDTMSGGGGNDTYIVDSSSDTIVEAADGGVDFVQSTASYTLGANVERMYLMGAASIDGTGNDLANLLVGNSGDNALSGLGANDRLYGGGGNDTLSGGDGNDYIEGGAGQDDFIGGSGKDYFVFRDGDFGGATAASADRIEDFAYGDRISLSPVDANTTLSGNQAFHFLGSSAFDGTAGALHYEQTGGNTYISGDTNGDGIADFMIKLDGLHTLSSGDFLL